VRTLLDGLPAGTALDAACGTGRHTSYLLARGHTVIGVDACPDMLDIARAKVPDADFRLGDLCNLPLPARSVDLVLCSLALTHLPALGPPFAEFARVLRPGGHLITADIHHLSLYLGGIVEVPDGKGRIGRLPASRFLPSDYLNAALAAGYTPVGCQEVPWPDLPEGHGGPIAQAWCPEAARAAYVGMPAVIIWNLIAPRASPLQGRRRLMR
jgi:SAM-dependent methyltransferase